jgi:hypothetical protein
MTVKEIEAGAGSPAPAFCFCRITAILTNRIDYSAFALSESISL